MAHPPIAIEYNRQLGELEQILAAVERPGDYHAFGRMQTPLPKITLKDVGVLSWPLTAAQAQAIADHAERAPYGRGEATLLDTSVRKVWQVNADKVELGGKVWPQLLSDIIAEVIAGLGCADRNVVAELYKFLLYDEGGFFVNHRDTEKSPGMFATLVVVLPSEHTGGELIVRHTGREAVFDPTGLDISEIAYAAFYADCEHEVRPIITGHRPCLVFNLIHKPAGKKQKNDLPSAPDYRKETRQAADLIHAAFASSAKPTKLVWLLEHQYSPAELDFACLKGTDAAVADVLVAAAEQADCAAHLALVHIEESGAAEPSYYPSYSRRYSRYNRYNDYDNDDCDDDEFEIIEAYDLLTFLEDWRDTTGQPKAFGQIPIGNDELLPADALEHEPPDEQRMTEATGNEGASYERSYLRAAITVWPHSDFANVLLQGGAESVLPYVTDQLAAHDGVPSTQHRLVNLAHQIIDAWPQRSGYFDSENPLRSRQTMLQLLVGLGDVQAMQRFIDEVVSSQYDGSENAVLAQALGQFNPSLIIETACALIKQHAKNKLEPCLSLFLALLEAADPEQQAALHPVAEACVAGLGIKAKPKPPSTYFWNDNSHKDSPQSVVTAPLLADYLDGLARIQREDLRLASVVCLSKAPAKYDPVTLWVDLLDLLHRRQGSDVENDPVYQRLWSDTAKFLLKRSAMPPDAPVDWKQEVTLEPSGDDWEELQNFARNPDARVHRFAVNQSRRQELHYLIEKYALDMTHVTERRGRPYTLVCTKTRRRYQERCQQYLGDIKAMQSLTELFTLEIAAVSGLYSRLQAAQQARQGWTPSEGGL